VKDFEQYWQENASSDSWANKAVAAKIWNDKQARIDELEMENTRLKQSIFDALDALNDGGYNFCQSELEKALRGEK